jgi:hypothetical protein
LLPLFVCVSSHIFFCGFHIGIETGFFFHQTQKERTKKCKHTILNDAYVYIQRLHHLCQFSTFPFSVFQGYFYEKVCPHNFPNRVCVCVVVCRNLLIFILSRLVLLVYPPTQVQVLTHTRSTQVILIADKTHTHLVRS